MTDPTTAPTTEPTENASAANSPKFGPASPRKKYLTYLAIGVASVIAFIIFLNVMMAALAFLYHSKVVERAGSICDSVKVGQPFDEPAFRTRSTISQFPDVNRIEMPDGAVQFVAVKKFPKSGGATCTVTVRAGNIESTKVDAAD